MPLAAIKLNCSVVMQRARLRDFCSIGSLIGPHAKLISCWIDVLKAAPPRKTDDLFGYFATSLNNPFSRPFQISGKQNDQRPCWPMRSISAEAGSCAAVLGV